MLLLWWKMVQITITMEELDKIEILMKMMSKFSLRELEDLLRIGIIIKIDKDNKPANNG